MTQTELPFSRDIYTVSRLNGEVALLLNRQFKLIWLEAEISNLSRPRSGHLYFSLKDENAQLRAAMFRNLNSHLDFEPKEGTQVLVRARIGLYEPRGDFQIIVEHMEETGTGLLRRAFDKLKHKLQQEGLFEQDNKQPLPRFPQRIGVITSPSGAAIQDVLSLLKRRYPVASVLLYPVLVQGESAAGEIVSALNLADKRQECDVLLLVRGGGSLEDLQAFNEESVARAIVACGIPLVCGVGHEVDFTIADFVADVRAATPTASAELASPDSIELREHTNKLTNRLQQLIDQRIDQQLTALQAVSHRLKQLHPRQQLNQQSQRLDELEFRIHNSWRLYLQKCAANLQHLEFNLTLHSPAGRISNMNHYCQELAKKLNLNIQLLTNKKHQKLDILMRSLNGVSPLATLERGYAIVTQATDHQTISDAKKIKVGEHLSVKLANGALGVTVNKIINKKTR